MFKKLLLLALPIAAIAVLSFQVVNADYYDCQGIRREGQPGPSECRQLKRVDDTATQINVEDDYEAPPKLTRLCRGVPCDEYEASNGPQRIEPNRTVEDDEEDLNIRKLRKYCVRNYCYFIYEICDSDGHCTEEAKRIKKDDVDFDNWRDWFGHRTYKYFYRNYYYPKRNYDYVYRGTHYGRYYNRYWDF